MNAILAKFNRKMVKEKRNIILLMDNVSSHSPSFCESFSNVKVVFLPVNTTSRLQPLDAGIIKNFKVHYRKQLLNHVLAKVNEEGSNENVSTICKSVNVLLAIRWIKQAWEDVTVCTIKNCFRRCGAIPRNVDEETATSAPFADLDSEEEDTTLSSLDGLVSQIASDITAVKYVNEDDLPTCLTFDGEDDVNLRLSLRSTVVEGCLPKRQDLDAEEDLQCSSIQSFDVALTLAKDLSLFLEERGDEVAVENQQKVISALQDAKLKRATKQSTLFDFVHQS